MAISQVRVNFNGQWYALAYNGETQRYEAEITPAASSHAQAGGYYGLTVEAANDTGQVSSISADTAPALRLTVKEATEPVLALVSPPQGYVTTGAPTVVFTVTDEPGGSGVDLDTLAVTLDGAAAPYTSEAIQGGYRVTCALSGLADGPHAVAAAVSDHDGNQAALELSYIVDTAPPELRVSAPGGHRIIDEDEIVVAGTALDVTAPPVVVQIFRNGERLGQMTPPEHGAFSQAVSLAVGINDITVAAADAAGLAASESFRVFRMVTDRTQADVDALAELLSRNDWTDGELARFNLAGARGAYNHTDLNRVTAAMEYLNALLTKEGYETGFVPVYPAEGRTVWLERDAPVQSQLSGYLANLERLRSIIPANVPQAPENMEEMNYEKANDIEKILVGVDAVHQYLEVSRWYAGEISCGEV